MSEGDTEIRADELEKRLRGTRVPVVGANGAVGSGTVEALSAAGCLVAASDIHGGPKGSPDEGAYFEADLTADGASEGLIGWAAERLGGIDVVVNGAGIGHVDPLESLPIETWRDVFAVNVEAALLLSQHAVQEMSAQPSTTSSVWQRR